MTPWNYLLVDLIFASAEPPSRKVSQQDRINGCIHNGEDWRKFEYILWTGIALWITANACFMQGALFAVKNDIPFAYTVCCPSSTFLKLFLFKSSPSHTYNPYFNLHNNDGTNQEAGLRLWLLSSWRFNTAESIYTKQWIRTNGKKNSAHHTSNLFYFLPSLSLITKYSRHVYNGWQKSNKKIPLYKNNLAGKEGVSSLSHLADFLSFQQKFVFALLIFAIPNFIAVKFWKTAFCTEGACIISKAS